MLTILDVASVALACFTFCIKQRRLQEGGGGARIVNILNILEREGFLRRSKRRRHLAKIQTNLFLDRPRDSHREVTLPETFPSRFGKDITPKAFTLIRSSAPYK